MKKMKKFFALLIAMAMVLGMSTSVFAASITINRDDTYAGEEDGAGRAYSYYKVFSVASKGEGFSQDFEGGYEEDEDGNLVPVTEQGEGKVAYTATADVAAKLGTWDEESGTWTKASGNEWFILAPIVDSTDFSVSWDDEQDGNDPDVVQAAAAWLIEKSAYESGPTAMTFADGKWTATGIDDGYYIVSGDTGNNLVAVTTDIEINEKNDYPPITKGQKEEDYPTTYVDENGDPVNVAIGDEVTYQVTVTVPKAAKVGDTIEVYDKITEGLTYSGGLKVTIQGQEGEVTLPDGTSYTGDEYAWDKVITVTADNKGAVYVFDYTMTINNEALFDTGRENEAGLKYGDEYESIPKTVNFTTYFAGIEKFDGDTPTTKLANVEFTLKEAGVEFKVTKTEDGYYIPDAVNGTSTVITDTDGLIKIRGLDIDKTYTLTETVNPNPGYNMVSGDFTLTLTEDKDDAFENATADTWGDVPNYQGTVLPSTGGIGTTIFYIVGAILVIGAGVVLVTRRRMNVQ